VNLSQRLLAPLREHPLDLYARLRTLNPAPFAGYFDVGDFQVLSASPERFLRVYPDGEVETRPIKGTRPRGATPEEDAALARDLAASAKDRAENVMIVDLLRNDIGKVDTHLLIRTFTAGRGWVQFPVGGGIVADSDPAREYEETLHKAAGLLRSL
jgi:para-aminobenzoate synthetase component 1